MTQVAGPSTSSSSPPGRRAPRPGPVRWSRAMWEAAVDSGLFEGRRIERIDGELIEMPTQNHRHAQSLGLADDWCRGTFRDGFYVRVQMPLAVDELNDPEPDVAVIRGRRRDATAHPSTAVLVIEVSDWTLRLDRNKARVYAAAGVEEYWILNVRDRELSVHRHPDPSARLAESSYRERLVLGEADTIAPLAAPQATVTVRDLLP